MKNKMISRSLYTSALTLMLVGATNFGDIPINTFVDNNIFLDSIQDVDYGKYENIIPSSVITCYASEPGIWEQQSTGKWKYKENNVYVVGWKYVNGKWYYMYESGIMASSCWISGLYYLGSDGAMLENSWTPDGYYVGSDGVWIVDYDESESRACIDSPSKTRTEESHNNNNLEWWEKYLGGPTHSGDNATDHDLSVKVN